MPTQGFRGMTEGLDPRLGVEVGYFYVNIGISTEKARLILTERALAQYRTPEEDKIMLKITCYWLVMIPEL